MIRLDWCPRTRASRALWLVEEIGQPFEIVEIDILGERFSAADVLVGSSVYFMRMFGMLPDSQALSDYADRCLARPAYARALQRET